MIYSIVLMKKKHDYDLMPVEHVEMFCKVQGSAGDLYLTAYQACQRNCRSVTAHWLWQVSSQ
jgi:hypothetical protein